MDIVSAVEGKKTNWSMALVAVAVYGVPLLASAVDLAGYPEWADWLREVGRVMVYVFTGGGIAGLLDKARRRAAGNG